MSAGEGSGQDSIGDREEAFGMHIHALQSQTVESRGDKYALCCNVHWGLCSCVDFLQS